MKTSPNRTPRRGLIRDIRGTAGLEFGFIAVAIISIFLGMMELGRFLWIEQLFENAAKQGARYATVRGDDSDITETDAQIANYVASRVPGFEEAELNITITWTPTRNRGSTVTVSLSTELEPMTAGFLPLESYTVNGVASLIVSQ